MSKPNVTEMEQEIRSQVELFVWRVPKKNHDAMVKLQKQFNDILIKHGVLRMEIFSSPIQTPTMVANIFNTVSANQDEEIWVELQSHRDLKRMDEITSEVMKDEIMHAEGPLVKQFIDLVTPGSGMIMGKFTRLKI